MRRPRVAHPSPTLQTSPVHHRSSYLLTTQGLALRQSLRNLSQLFSRAAWMQLQLIDALKQTLGNTAVKPYMNRSPYQMAQQKVVEELKYLCNGKFEDAQPVIQAIHVLQEVEMEVSKEKVRFVELINGKMQEERNLADALLELNYHASSADLNVFLWLFENFAVILYDVHVSEMKFFFSDLVKNYKDSLTNTIVHQVLEYFCFYMDQSLVYDCLMYMCKLGDKAAYALLPNSCRSWIAGSQNPIHAALYASHFFQKLYDSKKDEFFIKLRNEFTDIALNITKTIIAENRLETDRLTVQQQQADEELRSGDDAAGPSEKKGAIVPVEIQSSDQDTASEKELNLNESGSKKPFYTHILHYRTADDEGMIDQKNSKRRKPSRLDVLVQGIKKKLTTQDANVSLFSALFKMRDGRGKTLINILRESKNHEFLGDVDIYQVVEDGWKGDDVIGSWTRYYHWPFLQFLINCICLGIYATGFFLHLQYGNNSVQRPVENLEYLVYIGGASYLADMLVQIYNTRNDFFESGWNWINILFTGSFIFMALTRALGAYTKFMTEELQISYVILSALACVFLAFKCLYAFRINETLGTLIYILFQLVGSISRFMAIAVAVHLGFSVGFFFLLKNRQIDGYLDFSDTFYNLSVAFLTQIDPKPFNDIRQETQRLFVQFIFLSYIVLFVIVLVNLLIALLNTTYNSIAQKSAMRFRSAKSMLLFEFVEEAYLLPPPFTFLSLITGSSGFLVSHVLCFICMKRSSMNYCSFCLRVLNPRGGISDEELVYLDECWRLSKTELFRRHNKMDKDGKEELLKNIVFTKSKLMGLVVRTPCCKRIFSRQDFVSLFWAWQVSGSMFMLFLLFFGFFIVGFSMYFANFVMITLLFIFIKLFNLLSKKKLPQIRNPLKAAKTPVLLIKSVRKAGNLTRGVFKIFESLIGLVWKLVSISFAIVVIYTVIGVKKAYIYVRNYYRSILLKRAAKANNNQVQSTTVVPDATVISLSITQSSDPQGVQEPSSISQVANKSSEEKAESIQSELQNSVIHEEKDHDAGIPEEPEPIAEEEHEVEDIKSSEPRKSLQKMYSANIKYTPTFKGEFEAFKLNAFDIWLEQECDPSIDFTISEVFNEVEMLKMEVDTFRKRTLRQRSSGIAMHKRQSSVLFKKF